MSNFLSPNDQLKLQDLVRKRIRSALATGTNMTTDSLLEAVKKKGKQVIKEALVLIPKSFVLRTEYMSQITKENHFKLYKSYVDNFNIISAKLDSVSRDDAERPNNSEYRRLKVDEQHNLNGTKLHELYFNNISDLHSEIRMDSIPFMRLSRDWGTFESWQFDFRACGLAATEGWAVLYWEPFKQRYLNTFIEKHSENVPVMGIPVLVIDTWHHAWFHDHPGDKLNYLNSMLVEVNWSMVEARMAIAERSNVHQIFMLEPVGQSSPEKEVRLNVSNEPPIGSDQIVDKMPVGKS